MWIWVIFYIYNDSLVYLYMLLVWIPLSVLHIFFVFPNEYCISSRNDKSHLCWSGKMHSQLCYRLFSYGYTHSFYMDTSVRVTCDPYFVNCMGLNREDSIYASHFFDSIDISYKNSSPVLNNKMVRRRGIPICNM